MPDKPNAPYSAPALLEVLGDLLEKAAQIIPPPKPKPEKDKL